MTRGRVRIKFSLGTVLLDLGGYKEPGMVRGADNPKGECEGRWGPGVRGRWGLGVRGRSGPGVRGNSEPGVRGSLGPV